MNNFINCAKKLILLKDMTDQIDFNLIQKEFDQLTFVPNVENLISTDMDFFNKEQFANIKSILEDECKNFVRNAYAITDFTDLRMTESWGNVTKQNQSHHIHTHPFSVISAVLYLDNNSDNLNLHLEYKLDELPYFIPQTSCYLPLARLLETACIDPQTTNNLKNHLLLFTSNTSHFVTPSQNTGTRHTISFNTFWSGITGLADQRLGSIKF